MVVAHTIFVLCFFFEILFTQQLLIQVWSPFIELVVVVFRIRKDLLQLLLARVIQVGRLSLNRLCGLLEIKLQAFPILLLDRQKIFSFLAWLDRTATSGT